MHFCQGPVWCYYRTHQAAWAAHKRDPTLSPVSDCANCLWALKVDDTCMRVWRTGPRAWWAPESITLGVPFMGAATRE